MSFTSLAETEPFTPTFVPKTQLSDHESPIELANLEKADSDAAGRRKRSTCSKVEDEILARSFVTISDDPIIGNDQKVDAFWNVFDEDILWLTYEKYRKENNDITFNLEHMDDAARRKGLSPLQKCTAVIRQLSYGVLANHLDEYLHTGETTAIKCLFKFCGYVVELFGDRYLRRSNADNVQRLLQMHNERHNLPGMLGCLDCMHWE
ncbi:uncharacterized protein LOC121978762 [Zingiber officinale]|uniref:uncharacterized protein LOC121978762 n=1 Tax=Zingiber officinale TaxID=94328 RepID=UPI001C4DBABD|nr:uncharacterized protein LOC121978762 [Zingiber officinale]